MVDDRRWTSLSFTAYIALPAGLNATILGMKGSGIVCALPSNGNTVIPSESQQLTTA